MQVIRFYYFNGLTEMALVDIPFGEDGLRKQTTSGYLTIALEDDGSLYVIMLLHGFAANFLMTQPQQ